MCVYRFKLAGDRERKIEEYGRGVLVDLEVVVGKFLLFFFCGLLILFER